MRLKWFGKAIGLYGHKNKEGKYSLMITKETKEKGGWAIESLKFVPSTKAGGK